MYSVGRVYSVYNKLKVDTWSTFDLAVKVDTLLIASCITRVKCVKYKASIINKVNKWPQELIQSDLHQVQNIKRKDRQTQLNSHKKKRDDKRSWQLFPKKVATLLP